MVKLQPMARPAEGIGQDDVGAGFDHRAVKREYPVGMLLVPSLTSNIFSGGGGESVLSPRIAVGRLLRR